MGDGPDFTRSGDEGDLEGLLVFVSPLHVLVTLVVSGTRGWIYFRSSKAARQEDQLRWYPPTSRYAHDTNNKSQEFTRSILCNI